MSGKPGGGRLARVLVVASLALLVGGCGWFSWVPWIGDRDKGPDPMKPADLVDFVPEARIERLWRASVGKGLGRKYLRLNPVVVANRVYAADGYGVVEARDRFSGKRVWRSEISPYNLAKGGRFSGLTGFNFFDRTDPSYVSGGVGRRRRIGADGHHRGNRGGPVRHGRAGNLARLPRQRDSQPPGLRRRCRVRADHRRPPAGAGGGRRQRALELRHPGSRADAARDGLAGIRGRRRLRGVRQRHRERHPHGERRAHLGAPV